MDAVGPDVDGHALVPVDCEAASPLQEFQLDRSGQGEVRASVPGEACLTVLGDNPAGAGSVELRPCKPGTRRQTFIFPRVEDGTAFVGVNLGGWLVLEDWMWAVEMEHVGVKDEYSLIKEHGGPDDHRAQALMRRHWDTFLRPEHLDALRRFGVTHVRIPLGYWLFEVVYDERDGFVAGGELYLRRAMGWLKAVLDLHALPGAQARNQSFTGRASDFADFFLHAHDYERGERAVQALAETILRYETDPTTSGVVVGMELMNEPAHEHIDTTMLFYETMVTRVRQVLPADRYLVMLSFMGSPHSQTAEWLASKRQADPANFAGVVFDAHLYHLFGDNREPWSKDMDYCKTCCRDPDILAPMSLRGVPTVVGEASLSTGFSGWEDPGFVRANLENQLSLFNTTSSVVGSFLWNFRILLDPQQPRKYLEWSLLDLISEGFVPPDFAVHADLSALCPAMRARLDAGACPAYRGADVLWDTPCTWSLAARAAGRRLRGDGGGGVARRA